MNKKDETHCSCLCGFFMFIGFLFPMFMVGAFLTGSIVGEDCGGYVLSHNPWSWIVVGILLLIAIMCTIGESKKEKLTNNQEEEEEGEK